MRETINTIHDSTILYGRTRCSTEVDAMKLEMYEPPLLHHRSSLTFAALSLDSALVIWGAASPLEEADGRDALGAGVLGCLAADPEPPAKR